MERLYRNILYFFIALASTSLLPSIYFIKSDYELLHFESGIINTILNLVVYIGAPVLLSLLSLWWMISQGDDSITNDIDAITPVNNEYLPVYLGYIFVSLSIPTPQNGGVDWVILMIVYLLISLFVTCSKTLFFNPVFIVLGYGYYQVTTENGVNVFVMTQRKIKKSISKPTFPNLKKVNDLVYIDDDN